jgi:hypothetical protein
VPPQPARQGVHLPPLTPARSNQIGIGLTLFGLLTLFIAAIVAAIVGGAVAQVVLVLGGVAGLLKITVGLILRSKT